MKGICVIFFSIRTSFLIPLGTLPWQPILGKICKMTFIQHAGISQRIQVSQFRFRDDKGHYFCYIYYAILVKIGPLTPKISQGVSIPFGTRRQKSTYHTKYLSKYKTELYQLFSIGRLMYADYKIEIIFAVVEKMLLW